MKFIVGDVEKWVSCKETAQRTVDTSISNTFRQGQLPKSAKQEPGKLIHSNHIEASGESRLDNDMPVFKIELAGNPNSCIIKINKQKFCTVLDCGAEVSLIHARVYNSLKEKPNLKKQSAFLQSVKGDSIDVGRCASCRYEIGREKQEHEFFVVLK